MSGTKVCSACGVEKPATAEYFYLNGKRLRGSCKPCECPAKKTYREANADKERARCKAYREANPDKRRTSNKAWREANADKRRAYNKAWKIANPDKARAITKAWALANPEKRRAIQKAYYEANADKRIASLKAWSLANPEKVKAAAKAYYEANPEKYRINRATRKARTLNAVGSHTAADIRKLFAEQVGLCGYCSVSLASGYHVDHVVPLSRGGGNGPDNLCLACPRCNMRKGARLISEMR